MPIRPLLAFLLLVLAVPAGGQDGVLDYRALVRLRDRALAAADRGAAGATDEFVEQARRFLAAPGPEGAERDRIRVWLGAAIEDDDVRGAYALYRRARSDAARDHETRLRMRHEPPPPLTVERWLGTPVDPRTARGDVTAVIFLSFSHPQTRRVWPHLLRLHERLGAAGCRIVVLATVVDDHDNQKPQRIAAAVEQRRPPFPVAIDRQSRRGPSSTLRAYRGRSLPWAALLDRYGRLAWSGAVSANANALQRLEERIRELTAQPRYETLVKRVRDGDTDALAALSAIRTKDTVGHLLDLLARPGKMAVALLRTAVRALAPPHLALTADAAAWWKREHASYRYSLQHDRFLRSR